CFKRVLNCAFSRNAGPFGSDSYRTGDGTWIIPGRVAVRRFDISTSVSIFFIIIEPHCLNSEFFCLNHNVK
ncbi:MAG: hypothetical protein KAX81_00160, partial [Leadbetterella sp.]|nr:hypothetical protein [Leadbetterella sp.]